MAKTYLEAVRDSISTAEAHIVTEYDDDFEGTLASISRVPRYAMMTEPGKVAIVTDEPGVAQFYQTTQAQFALHSSRFVTQLASDWYVFFENVPTRQLLSSGKLVTLNTLTLFPKADDGIRGEFLWERYRDEREAQVPNVDNPQTPVPIEAVRNLKLHSDHLDRVRAGDAAGIEKSLSKDCIWAVRSILPDREANPMMKAEGPSAVRDYFEKLFAAWEIREVSVLTRTMKDWFVFAEEHWVITGRQGSDEGNTVQFRKASIYPVTRVGELQGELGYSTNIESTEWSERPALGRPFWLGEGYKVNDDGTITK
ncbi:MAG: nuclear transport factor 2 family protein [Nitratireductor sp.]|nr:nuclear transport factor 2 family protein [Nitratireductor sp.]